MHGDNKNFTTHASFVIRVIKPSTSDMVERERNRSLLKGNRVSVYYNSGCILHSFFFLNSNHYYIKIISN